MAHDGRRREVIKDYSNPGKEKNMVCKLHHIEYFANMPKYQCDADARKAPKGQFVVYVGEELRRFTLPLSYLKNPSFQQLLKKSAEEYGYSDSRGIVLPCDESTFESFFMNSKMRI
ncbi:hypothetical protein JHK87_015360 [Glycine soja]|nr:hypothetical protein JHK87_015360 [Glycine soja]